MTFLLTLLSGFTGFIANIATTIWNTPALRYGLLITVGLTIAFYYGGHVVAQRDAALAREQEYQATIAALQKTAALQKDITEQNAKDQENTNAIIKKQDDALQAYKDYIASIASMPVKGDKNAKNQPLPPCAVDQRLLDAIGVSK